MSNKHLAASPLQFITHIITILKLSSILTHELGLSTCVRGAKRAVRLEKPCRIARDQQHRAQDSLGETKIKLN